MKKFFIVVLLQILLCIPLFVIGCKGCADDDCITVTFIIDGGTYLTVQQSTDTEIHPPEIDSKDGYIFKGWYLTEEYIEKWNFDNDIIKENLNLYGYWVAENDETFNVLFYIDSELVNYIKIEKNKKVSLAPNPIKSGYTFSGWFSGNELFDFNSTVTDDLILVGSWELTKYKVTFVADGKTVKESTYTVEDPTVIIPNVPEKQYYSGAWEPFTLTVGDITVSAIYTPITYNVKYIADNNIIFETEYTVTNLPNQPEIPQKVG